MQMTPKAITESCKANGGYTQPDFNEQVFLQCKGYGRIQNLEPYTAVKALWLDSNAIRDMEGLESCTKLVALYLNNNCIPRIRGLDSLLGLHTLNLSHNVISQLSNLRHLPKLETLMITHNRLEHLKDLEELIACTELTCVDLSYNPLSADEGEPTDALVDFFVRMPKLAVLYLTGTEIVKTFRFYRRKMISRIATLKYLDERPVFEEERRCAEAWATGGEAAETLMRNAIHEEKKEKLSGPVRALQKLADEKKDIKEKRTVEWAKIQEKEDQWWRSKTQVFRDLANEEHGGREELDFLEDDAFVTIQSALVVEGKDIIETALAVQAAKDAKKRKQEIERATRSPVEESRQELLRQVALWGESAPHATEVPPEDDTDDVEGDALLKKFQDEVHAALYDLPADEKASERAPVVASPVSKPKAVGTHTKWRDVAMGGWCPPPSTLSVWMQYEKWENSSRQ